MNNARIHKFLDQDDGAQGLGAENVARVKLVNPLMHTAWHWNNR